jgi:DNA polymerase-3 subunit alpha
LEKALEEAMELKQLYESDEQIKKLVDTAKILEGVARHASTHAAGVVITKDPLNKIVPLQHPTQDDQAIVTQYEMHAIEDLGLLKMDFLGLKTLTQIENTINIVKNTKGDDVDIVSLALDDAKTYKLLQEAHTTGVFQLESGGMKRYLKELKPSVFEDIIAMVALYRPGPM